MTKLSHFTRVGVDCHVEADLEGRPFSSREVNKDINSFLRRTQESGSNAPSNWSTESSGVIMV